jgi:uncharacterized RDD family membrane protein YckC
MEAAQWFYVVDDRQVGPVSPQELGHLFRSRQLHPSTLVWSEGLTGWVMASTISGLVPVDAASAPPPIPPAGAYSAPYRRPRTVTYAGFWKRFVAALLDGLLLAVVLNIVGFLVGFMLAYGMSSSGYDMDAISAVMTNLGYLIGTLGYWLYFTLFESSARQATPGKMALGIVVTDLDGDRISFARANGRYWGKLLSVLTLFIGYLMAAFTGKKQTLHDMVAGCLVVNK